MNERYSPWRTVNIAATSSFLSRSVKLNAGCSTARGRPLPGLFAGTDKPAHGAAGTSDATHVSSARHLRSRCGWMAHARSRRGHRRGDGPMRGKPRTIVSEIRTHEATGQDAIERVAMQRRQARELQDSVLVEWQRGDATPGPLRRRSAIDAYAWSVGGVRATAEGARRQLVAPHHAL